MIIPVNNLGAVGLTPDLPFAEQQLNAWTAGTNVRFYDGAVHKSLGMITVLGTPVTAPYWLLRVPGFWLYGGLDKVGATDGTTNADISRTVGGVYNANAIDSWTGGVIEEIPVINNGVDDPQMWNTPALATHLVKLSNWPATTKCKVLRSYKRYLIALGVTKGSTVYPHMVKWSSAAATGSVPGSWDETDETIDAAEFTLNSDGGIIVDAVPMRDDMILYKETNVYRMSYVGGTDIFDFKRIFESFGALGPRCAVEFFSGKHIVFTGDDIALHDGNQASSVTSARIRSFIRGHVDQTTYRRSFVCINQKRKEVWVVFPEVGSLAPDRCIAWNWEQNTCGFLTIATPDFGTNGPAAPTSETWSDGSETWSDGGSVWGDDQVNPAERELVLTNANNSLFFMADRTNLFNGGTFPCSVERTKIGFPLKVQGPPDFTTEKLVRGIWPHITGTAGGVVTVSVGYHDRPQDEPTWVYSQDFTIGTTTFMDPLVMGRLHAIKFASTGDVDWSLSGYDVDVVAVGSR